MSSVKQKNIWVYGIHAVSFILSEKKRDVFEIWVTKNTLEDFPILRKQEYQSKVKITDSKVFSKKFGEDAVHQGIAAYVSAAETVELEDIIQAYETTSAGLLLCLDQVTDPHNVGAIVRSAAVFGAAGVIVQDRNSPESDTPTLVKSACGATEIVPLIRVTNLSQSLKQLQDAGWWTVGFDEKAQDISQVQLKKGKHVLLLGAEGKGLRRLTKEQADLLYALPSNPNFSTLNVSNAAAIASYLFRCI